MRTMRPTTAAISGANISAVPVVDVDNPRKVLALLERNSIGKAYNDKLAELKSN